MPWLEWLGLGGEGRSRKKNIIGAGCGGVDERRAAVKSVHGRGVLMVDRRR